MKKKLALIIVALSLIVSFGFANAYAAWSEGDPDDWYFQLEATDSTNTIWDVTFHAVDDAVLNFSFLKYKPARRMLDSLAAHMIWIFI